MENDFDKSVNYVGNELNEMKKILKDVFKKINKYNEKDENTIYNSL
jgi:hypothetical protein